MDGVGAVGTPVCAGEIEGGAPSRLRAAVALAEDWKLRAKSVCDEVGQVVVFVAYMVARSSG